MKKYLLAIGILAFAVAANAAGRQGTVYRWVDDEGIVHFDDSVPPEYRELNKDILTIEGVKIGMIRGRRTAEELEAERIAAELALQMELQKRADKALLQTYLSIDEIRMHRDRRVELFQAQSRVTQVFLTNLSGRLLVLEREASRYQPYSDDSDAELVDPDLVDEIFQTKLTIERHEANLEKFQMDEQQIVARFDGDISRFKTLKGLE
jgi:hypothetical protein